ncbi:MAG: xanthine dehydrogenase family protein molybdopterin-binding subunit [Acetobacteraceae bacterium]|nr:xanthine dehydrogenase family protein molybdopterin-binding subunit [Acetobacteraceae bacterium]
MDGDRFGLGFSPRRREDSRFLIGKGAYLDDLVFPEVAHAVFVRSPHAHAGIAGIDTVAALAAPGVLAVLTAVDVAADGLNALPPTVEANVQTGERFHFTPLPLLARDEVRYVGQLVALVVAGTKAQALDAAELVRVDYNARPAVMAPEAAAEIPGLLCMDWRVGGADAAFANAAHVVSLHLHNHRIVTNPMEPRGVVGVHDAADDRYTAHVSSQSLHVNRDAIARVLNIPPEKLRFVAPDVGGGFGAKNFPYPEQALIPWASKRCGRPVKWIASRSEVFVSDHQARDHLADASLALDAEGRFLGLRVDSIANIGAYMCGGAGSLQTFQYLHLQGGIYNIPQVGLRIRTILTNATPIGVTRGPGFAEAVNIIERLIDAAARRHGFDRAALRRRNMARTPMTNALGFVVDSGDFAGTFDKALAAADLPGFDARRRESETNGRLRGLGFACHIKGTGGNPSENVDIRFDADGTVQLITGTQTIGQGHETTFPQIVAHCLGIPNDRVRLVQGDTAVIRSGGGHGSSRATYMGGTAIFRASEEIVAKGRPIAASMLEAAEADIGFAAGAFSVIGTDRGVALLDVAAKAREDGTPLDTYHFWTREHMTFPNGTHVVEVEIDRGTGRVSLARHTAVDDYGVIVNPMIAAGQAHGAIAQGAGQALMEQAVFDDGSGQVLTGSFMDYTLPRADDFPSFDLTFNNTPCTTNPLGVKGCGEAAAVGIFPAINTRWPTRLALTAFSTAP